LTYSIRHYPNVEVPLAFDDVFENVGWSSSGGHYNRQNENRDIFV